MSGSYHIGADQKSWPRTIVQIAAAGVGDGSVLFALAGDGSLWQKSRGSAWSEVEALPPKTAD
jgi:hypothetical protein